MGNAYCYSEEKGVTTLGVLKDEVLEFYRNKNVPIERMIAKWPQIPPGKIKEAAEVVFKEITEGGLQIKDISIGWRVRELTKVVEGNKYLEDNKQAKESLAAIRNIEMARDNIARDRDFWKAKHAHLVRVLNDKEGLIRLGIEKRRQVKLKFSILYAASAWLWAICEISRAF